MSFLASYLVTSAPPTAAPPPVPNDAPPCAPSLAFVSMPPFVVDAAFFVEIGAATNIISRNQTKIRILWYFANVPEALFANALNVILWLLTNIRNNILTKSHRGKIRYGFMNKINGLKSIYFECPNLCACFRRYFHNCRFNCWIIFSC